MDFSFLEITLFVFLLGFSFLILFIRKREEPNSQESKPAKYLKFIFILILLSGLGISFINIFQVMKSLNSVELLPEINSQKIKGLLADLDAIIYFGFSVLLILSISLHYIGIKREKLFYLISLNYFSVLSFITGFFLSDSYFHYKKINHLWKGEFSMQGVFNAVLIVIFSLVVFILYFILGKVKYRFKGKS